MTVAKLLTRPVARRAAWRAALTALAWPTVATLAGCAGLLHPDAVTISEAELARLLARHFPLERRLMEVLDLTLDTPQLTLLPERNRLAVDTRVSGRDRLFGGAWAARLSFDSALRWDPQDQTLRLDQVRVNALTMEGTPAANVNAAAQRVAPLIAERLLDQLVVYRLTPERAQQLASQGLQPQGVSITRGGVEIRLRPRG